MYLALIFFLVIRDTNDEVDLSRRPIYNLVFSTLDDGSFLSVVQAKTPYNYVHEHNAKLKDTQLCFKYPPDGINLISYMLPEYFLLSFKNVKVTLGATGRVLQNLMVTESSDRLPKKCAPSGLSEDAQMFLHEYFGPDIPTDLKYLVYSPDNGLMQPFESVKGNFYQLLGKQFPDYPIMLVSPDARVHAVIDLQGNFRFVAIGKYDTYQGFIANGPSLWHNILPENIQLEWMSQHIKPVNEKDQFTILSEVVQPDVVYPNGTTSMHPIIVKAVASKLKIATYPRIFPEESAKLKDSKNPHLANFEDKSLYDDINKPSRPGSDGEKVRLCYNQKCQAPLTTGHKCPCGNAWYCDKKCQSADWKAGHKLIHLLKTKK
jgi:hypothetical protein